MKNKLNITFLFIFLATVTVLAEEEPPRSKPIDLIIICDTSWSTERYQADFRSLSRQGISSLQPGDYLEVITAEAGKPRLRIAQSIKSGDSHEVQSINTVLKNISCPFLSDARLDDALEMAVKRLDGAGSQESGRESIIIVLTDGQLYNNEAKKICQLAAGLRKRNCKLYLTGTSATNKRIFIAASQGLFNWSLISQANPRVWIQELRKISATRKKEQPMTEPALKDKDAETTKARFTFKGQIEGPISTFPSEDILPSEPVIKEQETQKETKRPDPEIIQRLRLKLKKILGKYFWWILSSIAALLSAFAVVWLVAIKNTKRWKTKISSRLKTNKSQHPGVLIANLNGQTYRLGNPERINAIHIGRDEHNTIRTPDKSISNRHLRIYRKGTNLMLKNLGRTPVSINGSRVKPRGKHRLVLPSVIRLNEKTKLNLAILRPKVISQQDRRNEQDGKERK